jgi:DNA repair exonuclease SbcCD ATPase subunit
MDQTRNSLFQQVRHLEDENHDHLKTIADLTAGLEVRARALKAQMQGLKEMRDNIVSIDQLGADLSLEHAALLNGTRAQQKRQDVIIETARGLSERLNQAKESIGSLEKFKLDYRIGKQEIQESKQELVNLHNRFLGTLPEMSERTESLAVSMKDALIRLDRATGQLETRLAGMDVQITKLAMTFVGPTPEFERGAGLDLAAHERVAREIREALQEDQEMIVERLRKLVEDLRQDAQAFTALRESIDPIEQQHP